MVEIKTFKPGGSVHYAPTHGKKENGVVKSISEDGLHAFVVYHCNGEWHKYYDYTAARTSIADLREGWVAQ